jgi:hypothetical protein
MSLKANVSPWYSSNKCIFLALSSVTVGVTLGTLKVEYDRLMMSRRATGSISLGAM